MTQKRKIQIKYWTAVLEKDLFHSQRFGASDSERGRGRVLFEVLNSCYRDLGTDLGTVLELINND